MKTFWVALLLFWVLTPLASSQQRRPDREHDQLVGSVKSVKIEKAKLSNKGGKWIEGRHVRDRIWTYDKNGDLTDERIGTNNRLYSYDSKGNRLEKRNPNIIMGGSPESIDYHNQVQADDGSILYKWIPKYDAQGNRIEEAIYLSNREVVAQVYLLIR